MSRLLRFLTSFFRSRRAFDTDMRDEFAFHVEARADALIRGGLSPDDARRQARMEFGSLGGYEDRGREAAGIKVVDDLVSDLQFGFRMLRCQPGAALIIVLTLALGVGANTAIFSVVYAVQLQPLPVHEPDRLVLFTGDSSGGTHSTNTPPEGAWPLFSSESFDYLRAQHLPFEGIAAFAGGGDTVTARALAAPGEVARDAVTRVSAHLVSGNYFDVMSVSAARGRTLAAADDRAEAPPVAVVSDRGWHSLLDADPHAVGRVVVLNKVAFTIVGVMPESFFGERVENTPDLWVPLARQPDIQLRESFLLRPDYYWLNLIGRLSRGQTQQSAESATTVALRQFLTDQAGSSPDAGTRERIRGVSVAMVSGARGISRVREQNATLLTLLLVAVGLVLLIACTNVATLLLCRATSRGTEVAVRRALGASRARLVRQWLTESVLFALIGAAGGLLVAHWTAPALLSLLPLGPIHATLSAPVLVFTTAITALASLVFGLAPALQAGRVDALAALRSAGRGTRQRRRSFGATEPFVIAQIAVSLVLVVGATLFGRTLLNLEQEPLGFDQDRVLLVRISPRLAGYTVANVGALYRRLYDQLAALPGVEHATFARYSPFAGNLSSFKATVEGYEPAQGQDFRLEAVEIGPTYPETLGMPVLMGRSLTFSDAPGAKLAAMVNEAFVRRFFPASSPLGHHFRLNEDYEIVGVFRDALFHSARDQMVPFVFTSMLQDTSQRVLDCEIALRASGDASGLGPAVREIVRNTDSRVLVTRMQTLRTQVLATFGPERLAAGFVAAFAGLALVLAAVGLYGVVSHSVVRRTKEIGVRLALGAAGGDIVWLLVRDTLSWLAVGIAIGAIGSALAGRAVASQLFAVSAGDITSFVLASAVLAAVAVIASLIPAIRALGIHPTVALRMD